MQRLKSLLNKLRKEANSLVALLGVNTDLLHRPNNAQPHIWLPSIQSWRDDGLDTLELGSESEENDDDICEAEELQKILDAEENSPISRGRKVDEVCLNLTSAALSLATEDAAIVYVSYFILFSITNL